MNHTIDTPFELFFDQLRDLYSMELQLCESMPHLVSLCTNEGLRDLIVSHANQNCNQIEEITAIFERHGESPGDGICKAIAGLIEGGSTHLEGVRSPHTRDLMMIGHCLRIEAYERAAYEFTTVLSGRLGLMREPLVLSELLAQEKDMTTALILMEPILFEVGNSHACGSCSAASDALESLKVRPKDKGCPDSCRKTGKSISQNSS